MAESKQKSWLSDISEKIQYKKKSLFIESASSSAVGDSAAEPSKAEAGNVHKHEDNKPRVSRGKQITYILVSVVTAILAIIVIVASVNIFLFITYASFDQSVRQKGALVLAASAVVTLGLLIGGLVSMRKGKRKTGLTVASLLILVAVVQALVVGISVAMHESDKEEISEAMAMSFGNNVFKGPSRDKWNFIQSVSNCCGVLSPEDYRDTKLEHKPGYPPPLLPPNVPISCCNGYNPDLLESEQEQNRQRCRFQRSYHRIGCQQSVIYTASSMAVVVSGVGVVLIVLEIITAIPLFSASRKQKPVLPEPKPEGIKVEERKGSVSQNK